MMITKISPYCTLKFEHCVFLLLATETEMKNGVAYTKKRS